MTKPAPFILLSAGHHPDDPGCQHPESLDEHVLNCMILTYTAGMLPASFPYFIIPTGVLQTKVEYVNEITNDFAPDPVILMEFHVNAAPFAREAHGLEVLYYPSSTVGRAAADILGRSASLMGLAQREPKERPDLALLRKTRPPALIIECGFMTNPMDRRRLNNRVELREICYGLSKGIMNVQKMAHSS